MSSFVFVFVFACVYIFCFFFAIGNQGNRVRMHKAIVCAYAKQLVAHAQDKEWCITCNKHWTSMLSYLSYLSVLLDHPVCSEYFYLPMLLKPFILMKWNQPLKTLENAKRNLTLCKLSKLMSPQWKDVQKLLKQYTGPSKPCWQDWSQRKSQTKRKDILQCKLFWICFVVEILAAKPY